jgi:hypothetical protein
MAGTLTLSTLSDGTNSTSATNAIQGSAKAWVNWYGISGIEVRASYNVSSVTRTSTGQYTITFTNAMTDLNYCVATSANPNNTGRSAALSTYTSVTASAFNTICNDTGNATVDANWANVVVFR